MPTLHHKQLTNLFHELVAVVILPPVRDFTADIFSAVSYLIFVRSLLGGLHIGFDGLLLPSSMLSSERLNSIEKYQKNLEM